MVFPKYLKIASLPTTEILNEITGKKEQFFNDIDNTLTAILAEKLGFAYEFVSPENREYGRLLPNGNWTGMVGMLQHNQVDLIFNRLSVSEERSRVIDFSYPYTIDQITFATRPPEYSPSVSSFMAPFSFEVWISLLVCVSTIPLVHFVLFLSKHSLQRRICRTPQRPPCNVGEYLLKASYLISDMFLRFCYTAVLLSFLIYPSFPSVRTIADLATAVAKGKYLCSSVPGAYFQDALMSSTDSFSRIIGKSLRENEASFTNIEGVLSNSKIAKTPAFVESYNQLLPYMATYFVSDDVFFVDMMAVGVKKNFCCSAQLDSAINYVWASGIYSKLLNDDTLKHSKRILVATVNYERRLSIKDFQGPFILLIGGYVMAVIVVFIEIIVFKYNLNKRKQHLRFSRARKCFSTM